MTSRERWILYPLLFLTLGIVMRDKVLPQSHFHAQEITAYREIEADRIRCNQLEVGTIQSQALVITGPSGAGRIQMRVVPGGGGWIEVIGAGGKPLLVAGANESGDSGMIELSRADGTPQVQLWSQSSGGVVTTADDNGDIWLAMGHFGPSYGVFAESPRLGRRVRPTLPWRIRIPPTNDLHKSPE